MMKTRSKSYLRTFPNTSEGVSEYKEFIWNLRKYVKGGRFCKFFRGGKRSKGMFLYSGCDHKEGATHFDCYLLHRGHQDVPTFFNFLLKGY